MNGKDKRMKNTQPMANNLCRVNEVNMNQKGIHHEQ